MDLDLSNLPQEPEKLQILVSDLSRRLQNALHMVDAQKNIVSNATSSAEMMRNRQKNMSTALRLEIAKNETYHRSKIKEEEFVRYEQYKKKTNSLHDELRLALLDHSMGPIKKEPGRILKLRTKLEKMESHQDSQKLLLQHLSEQERLIEGLSAAAQRGNLEECRLLVRKGANVNEMDSAGFLPIHYASAHGFDAVARLMLEYGSDVSSYLSGYTSIGLAAQNGHGNVIKVLVEFGADVEEKGKNGCPPLVTAAANNHVDCVNTLLDLGANINSSDLNGNTALHVVAKLPNPSAIITLLLARGANSKLTNNQGYAPLQLALSIVNVPAMEAFGGRHEVVIGGGGIINPIMDNNDMNTSISETNDALKRLREISNESHSMISELSI